ncbi:MAG: flagellar hook-length control protein FliK [Bdellovibrionaceae bacterium]|nr:flagellar hook-length control protein FliK [Pseudobdellovibrionaceae bacterium]
MELISTVATPPSLMKLKTELGKGPGENSLRGRDQGNFSEVLKNQTDKRPQEPKAHDRISIDKKGIARGEEPSNGIEKRVGNTESPVKKFQTKGQSDRMTSEREKAILKFMDSFESEFGVPPREMVVAMAGLSEDQMSMAPEETAETVIGNLDLDDGESERAQLAYVGFLTQLSLIDSKIPKPFLVDPKALSLRTLAEASGNGGMGGLHLRGLQGLDPNGLQGSNPKGLQNFDPRTLEGSASNRLDDVAESATSRTQADSVQLVSEGGEASAGEVDSELQDTRLNQEEAKGEQASSSQAFLKPQVRQRVLASLERKAERDLSVQNLNNKFWMTGPPPNAQALALQGALPTGNAEEGTVGGDQMLDRLIAQENLPGSEAVGFDSERFVYEPGRGGKEDAIPFMVGQGFAPKNSSQKNEGGEFQEHADDSPSEQGSRDRSNSIGGSGQKKVSVDDMNFRQMADALNGDRSLSQGQSSGASRIGNHTGAEGLALSKSPYENEGNIKEIMNQAQYLIKNGGGEMKVKMSPEGLGELQLKVLVSDGKVNVQMVTETKEAKNAIESSLSDLKNSLSAQRLSVEHVKIDVVAATNAENKADQGMNSNPNGQRDSTKQFWNQFQESFGNRSQRDGLFDMSGRGYVSKKEREPLQPIAAPANARRTSGKGSGLNLVA